MNRPCYAIALVAALAIVPSAALAQCDLTGYVSQAIVHSPSIPIPDGFSAGIEGGTIVAAPAGMIFTDVIAELHVDHGYMGDLVATLTYDVECDGTPEASSVLICRQGDPTACLQDVPTTFGCAGFMACGNTYRFSDAADNDLTNGGTDLNCNLATPDLIAGGCFQTSLVAAMPLSAFDGLALGGCFKLRIADWATPDAGALCGWGVHYTFTGPTAAETGSWGGLKTLYR